jgi:hypothetical protein
LEGVGLRVPNKKKLETLVSLMSTSNGENALSDRCASVSNAFDSDTDLCKGRSVSVNTFGASNLNF